MFLSCKHVEVIKNNYMRTLWKFEVKLAKFKKKLCSRDNKLILDLEIPGSNRKQN